MREYRINNTNKTIILTFETNKDIVVRIKDCTRASRWNYELLTWTLPVDQYSAHKISKLIKDFKFKPAKEEGTPSIFDYMVDEGRLEKIKAICEKRDFSYVPRTYQYEALNYALEKRNLIIGDDVGCISGDMMIQANRAKRGFQLTLKELFYKFNGGLSGNRKWDPSIPTRIKSFDEQSQTFIHNEVEAVVDKGSRLALKVKLKSGKEITLTPDHEVYTKKDGWIAIEKLNVGDDIFSNGRAECKRCGNNKNLITYKYSKYIGYCKRCMYRYPKDNPTKLDTKINSDGYISIPSQFDHPRCRKNNGYAIPEHILIMEKKIGRHLRRDEVVHHKNHIKTDNAISNLQLVSAGEHAKIHSKENYQHFDSDKIKIVPISDKIISIDHVGYVDVYDIIMKDPHRSFVANEILVHNCGKTFEAIMYAEVTDSFPCLVITPASVKYNWGEKWGEITKEKRSISIIESKETKKRKNNWNADVVIINYDIIGKKQGKGATVRFQELLDVEWKMNIFDEGHFLKTTKSIRSKAAKKIVGKRDARIQLLTGTATMNKPIELWNLLCIIKKETLISKHWKQFTMRYCDGHQSLRGWYDGGATNTLELNQKIRENCYIRREKRDVLKDMPPITSQIINIPINNQRSYIHASTDFIGWVKQEFGDEKADKAMEAQALVMLTALRKLVIEGKLKAIEQYLKDWKEVSIEKLLIFGLHREQLDYLSKKFDCKLIAGGVFSKKKQEIVNDFQKNDDLFLFLNQQSGGTGIDGLQNVCSNMIILELPWRPSDLQQVIGRLDRSGQELPVTVTYLLAKDTIDYEMWEMLEEKELITEAVNKGVDVNKIKSGLRIVLEKFLKKSK